MLDKYVSLTVSFLLLFFVCAFYYPYIGGGFVFDDIPNLTPLGQIASDGEKFWQVVLSNNSGPTGRPVSMFFFALQYSDWPTNPSVFQFVNVFIHAFNTLLVCHLCGFLLEEGRLSGLSVSKNQIPLFSAMGSLFWAFHPGNVSSVLYVVQRMNLLSVFFGLSGVLMVVKLLQWARVRRYNQLTNVFPAGPVVPRDFLTFIYILFFFAVTLILSVFAKENGILFLGLLPWVYFLAGNPHPLYHKNILRLTLALVVVSCFVFLAASISFAIDGYGPRDFTLAERCLTQVWVLMRYLSWFWLPSYSNFHFFHDDVALVYSLFDERFIGAVCFWGAMLYIACRFRLFRFALGWFFISHLLESTIIPLEMVFEHRNYLATIGFSFLLTYGFIWLYLRWGAKLLALVVGVLCVYWAINFYMVAQSWSSRENMAIFWSDSSPQSPRLHGMKGDLYTNLGRYEEAEQEYRKIILKAPDSVMGYLALLELQCSYDSAVFPFEDFVARSKVAKYEASVINVLGEIIDLREEGLCKKIDNGYLWAILKVLQENPNVNAGRATGNFLLLEGRLCFEAEDLNCFIQRFEAAAIELKHYSILDNLYSVYLQLYGKETAQLYIEQLKLKMKE